MARPVVAGATSALALQPQAQATPARLASDLLGRSASADALARLNAAVDEIKALAIQPMLHSAVAALNGGNPARAAEWSMKALERDERCGQAWYILAVAREQAGDFATSVSCYEAALQLLPDHAEIANNLGRLAFRIGQINVAEQLFIHFLARYPNHPEGANNLACAYRSQGRFDEAIEVLKAALTETPEQAELWNTLGTVLAEQGDTQTAAIFFNEALRLKPDFAKARYNRGNMHLALGQLEDALADCETAISQTHALDEKVMMRLARSTILIDMGRVGEGWDEYEARLDPNFADVTVFRVGRPKWTPGDDLNGKSFLLVGEQGLGDEILFANVIPDIVDAIGPEGRLSLAVEKRLVGLFQRSFPNAKVGSHLTGLVEGRTHRAMPFLENDLPSIDLWAPLASTLRQYRRSAMDFPDRVGFLTPDPERVAHWRSELAKAPAGMKVGLLWKSAIISSGRHRFFSPFDCWAPVLKTPGVTFVNLQYGDCAEELEKARRDFGVEIWSPQGIDLKQDLDDVCALASALDLTIGFSNASFNLAAAGGAAAWLITTPGAWPRLGTNRYPWYPQVQVFQPPEFGAWEAVMSDIAESLAKTADA